MEKALYQITVTVADKPEKNWEATYSYEDLFAFRPDLAPSTNRAFFHKLTYECDIYCIVIEKL